MYDRDTLIEDLKTLEDDTKHLYRRLLHTDTAACIGANKYNLSVATCILFTLGYLCSIALLAQKSISNHEVYNTDYACTKSYDPDIAPVNTTCSASHKGPHTIGAIVVGSTGYLAVAALTIAMYSIAKRVAKCAEIRNISANEWQSVETKLHMILKQLKSFEGRFTTPPNQNANTVANNNNPAVANPNNIFLFKSSINSHLQSIYQDLKTAHNKGIKLDNLLQKLRFLKQSIRNLKHEITHTNLYLKNDPNQSKILPNHIQLRSKPWPPEPVDFSRIKPEHKAEDSTALSTYKTGILFPSARQVQVNNNQQNQAPINANNNRETLRRINSMPLLTG